MGPLAVPVCFRRYLLTAAAVAALMVALELMAAAVAADAAIHFLAAERLLRVLLHLGKDQMAGLVCSLLPAIPLTVAVAVVVARVLLERMALTP
jgi:hypothetical protein